MDKVDKKCKCRFCHWYRPKRKQRCWGFNKEDIKACIENGYDAFKGRNIKILKIVNRHYDQLQRKEVKPSE